jgi:hypothetical protein
MVQAVSRKPLAVEAQILWWTNWHWDRFLSGFPLSVSFDRSSPYSYVIWEMNNTPVSGRSSETVSSYRHEQDHSPGYFKL